MKNIFIFLMLGYSFLPAQTMTIFVSPVGSTEGTGTVEHPFSKINDAINFSGAGDTIFVLPGEYREDITLKDSISLIGSSAATTKILSSNPGGALITGNNNVVKGFTFYAGLGILCFSTNVVISENILVYAGGEPAVGIIAGSYNNIVISKNIILNFRIGVLTNAAAFSAGPLFIRNNIIRSTLVGISSNTRSIELFNNTIVIDVIKGFSGSGVSLFHGTAVVVNNCFAGYPSENGLIRSFSNSDNAPATFEYNNSWNCDGDLPDTVSSTNISADPQFKNISKNNFHLTPSSQCKNKGNPATGYNDPDGSRNDIGAYGGPDPLPEYLTFSRETDISLNNVSGFSGDTVTVEVTLSNAAGLKNASLEIQFDNSAMTFLGADTTLLTGKFSLSVIQSMNNTVKLGLKADDEIVSGSGSIIQLKFVLNPLTSSDKRSPIEIGEVNLIDSEQSQIFVSSITNGSCIVQVPGEYTGRIFVDGNKAGLEAGTILHPYTTIQKGIANASPGDTVIVAAGKYTGPIIMRSKVFVLGLGANTTSIDCPNDPYISTPAVVRFNNVDSSGIAGFSLINHDSLGTVVEIISSNAVIAQNKIDRSGTSLYAIIADANSRVVIEDNFFAESKYSDSAMVFVSAHDAVISRNVFSPSTATEIIFLNSAQRVTVSNNRFYSAGGRGLSAYGTKKTLVANNLFAGGTAVGFGIRLIDAESTLVVNNIFDACKTGMDETNGTQEICSNIFIDNEIALSLEPSTTHHYNLFWGNGLNVSEGEGDLTEITANPLFVNPFAGNFKLQAASPAINSGHPMFEWNDNDGSRNDMGLYGGPYADNTMAAIVNSRLRIGNVGSSPGDTVIVPIYAMGIAGISGIEVLITYDAGRLTLLEVHTTAHTRDFVLARKHLGNSIVELRLQGYHSMVLDSGAVIEMKFAVNKSASGTIPLNFQNVQLFGGSTQVIEGIPFENGEINLFPNSVHPADPTAPVDFALRQNYPNPFNPSTTIEYSIPHESVVQIRIFDILGREVKLLRSERQQAGKYRIVFNASALSSGLYFYRLRARNFSQTKKMLLVK